MAFSMSLQITQKNAGHCGIQFTMMNASSHFWIINQKRNVTISSSCIARLLGLELIELSTLLKPKP